MSGTCEGITAKGVRCSKKPKVGEIFCHLHLKCAAKDPLSTPPPTDEPASSTTPAPQPKKERKKKEPTPESSGEPPDDFRRKTEIIDECLNFECTKHDAIHLMGSISKDKEFLRILKTANSKPFIHLNDIPTFTILTGYTIASLIDKYSVLDTHDKVLEHITKYVANYLSDPKYSKLTKKDIKDIGLVLNSLFRFVKNIKIVDINKQLLDYLNTNVPKFLIPKPVSIEQSHYDILESRVGDSLVTIKRNYIRLVRVHHPDKNPDSKLEKTEITKKLNSAFEYLKTKLESA